ncbi:membrane protein YqaA with SNARE-associated domain [Mesocricetibacter intestinalis]|uniref:Membrane protein YqaA with SNARE-associated domain n=1 Tax=Mesocricetibacter intestinalis TaxID=1521930 RepID=A0A4R6V8Z3_9PAST|nr:DedA family protein [Mesocricetibacter intestinalis]TDQ58048.1 membrane protein YqaA with SNARE-associated domain [Mesocricetibacter intestinalis]
MNFDWLSWLQIGQQHGPCLMFSSAFLSATLLPGNSEVVFIGLMAAIRSGQPEYFSPAALFLLFTATLGNSLGGFTSYWLGRLLPSSGLSQKSGAKQHWVMLKLKRYGAVLLLLGWLPVLGDIFCSAAGWLRLRWCLVLIFLSCGKFLRYLFLFFALPL